MVRQKQIGVGDHDSGNHVSGPPRVGVSDFPISKDMPLTGVWNHEPNANGPVITAIQGALDISRAPVKAANQYTSLSIQHQLQVQGGTIITFKVKYDFIHATDEVKFSLPAHLVLRYNGHHLSYCWWDETIEWFHELCRSTIQMGCSKSTTITLVISPSAIHIFEDGNRLAVWNTEVSSPFFPVFNWQILSEGGAMHATLSDLIIIEPKFGLDMNTPWDFAFSNSTEIALQIGTGDTWTVRNQPHSGMAVTFSPDGYMRISTPSLKVRNSWVVTSAPLPISSQSESGIIQYRLRINSSSGSETKLTIYDGLILRITRGGWDAEWDLWVDDWFVKQSDTSIVVGSKVWTVVTVVYSKTRITLFEDGEGKFSIPRQEPLRKPNEVLFHVQHLDEGTAVSVDISHVRCVPGIKSEEAMVKDLQESLLLSYPMQGDFSESISKGQEHSLDLVLTDKTLPESWIRGTRAPAIDFAFDDSLGRVLRLPIYPYGRSFEEYTLAACVRVEAFPSGLDGQHKAGIVGPLSLMPDGRLEVTFRYASDKSYSQLASTAFVSKTTLPLGQWVHVTTTYSHKEARWALYINGELDSIVYATPTKSIRYAITPVMGYIGASVSPATGSFVVLQGQICDVAFWKQPTPSVVVRVLAKRFLADRREHISCGRRNTLQSLPLHPALHLRPNTTT